MPGPLTGIRVLDLTRVLAGPLCTMALGDLGADVIKVERPGTGDETRGWGPPFDAAGESAYFLAVNRNKLSVALDLDLEADRGILLRLLGGADVVVDNFLPGTLERRGLDPVALLRAHPRLIWCTLTGFDTDPSRPGYDFVVQAESGWMAITGEPDGDPMKIGVALADVVAGKDAAVAILGSLVGRATERSAQERRLTVSLAHSAVAALVNVAQNTLVSGAEPMRWGNGHPNLVPYQLFEAADRPLALAVGNDAQWLACCRVLGLEREAADLRFITNAGRVHHRTEVVSAVAAALRGRPAADWLARLGAAGVPVGVVRRVSEALADVAADPGHGIPPRPPASIRRPPPHLDQHGAAVRRLGWEACSIPSA
ncbi:MAG TPA: CoA transferase [Gemmatimonadales bacterium]|nr:CoA transferase [Gemmatimonadales bacterium]